MTAFPGLGIAFLGGGFMATIHSRAARSAGARLIGALAANREETARTVSTLGLERGYRDLDTLLADDAVDVVHVCTPNTLHHDQALAAINAGKAVICEKPLATTVTDAANLAHRARDAGVVAAVPFAYRFHPMVREARARVRKGELGLLTTVAASYLQDWLLSAQDDNWRVDAKAGGRSRAFGDIGSHLVDMIEFVTGDRIERLSATKRTVFSSRAHTASVDTEDAVAVSAVFGSGALATLLVSQVAPGFKNRLRFEISGTETSYTFDQESPERLLVGRRRSSEILVRDARYLAADAARLCQVPAGHPQGYQEAFNALVADTYTAVTEGVIPDGLPTFDDGLRAAIITDAVMSAAEDEQWVVVETADRITSVAKENAA